MKNIMDYIEKLEKRASTYKELFNLVFSEIADLQEQVEKLENRIKELEESRH